MTLRKGFFTSRVIALSLLTSVGIGGCSVVDSREAETASLQSFPSTSACVPDSEDAKLDSLVVGNATGIITEPYIAWGIQQRCFEKYGLDVESLTGSSPAARLAGLVGGSIDVVAQAPRFVIQSMANGEFEPLFVSAHYGYSEEELALARQSSGFAGQLVIESAFVSAPGSSISQWSDLDGAKIGVLSLDGQTTKGLTEVSRLGEFDMSTVELVQLDQQETFNALLRGDLDAGALSGSLAVEILNRGGHLIGYPAAFFLEAGPVIAWVAEFTGDGHRLDRLARFQQALWEVQQLLSEERNQQSLIALMQRNYGLDDATRDATRLPTLFPRQVAIEELNLILPAMVEAGDIDAPITFDSGLFLGGPGVFDRSRG